MNSLMDKLKKNSTIKDTSILSESKFFNAKDMIQTAVPMINVALSGKLDGGLTPALTVFAGSSKHFKTAFALLLAKSYLDKYDDAVVLFYDSEFGSPQSYFDSFGINTLAADISIFEAGMPPMVTASALAAASGMGTELAVALAGLGLLLAFVSLPLLYALIQYL